MKFDAHQNGFESIKKAQDEDWYYSIYYESI